MKPTHARSSGSKTLLHIRSPAACTIGTGGSSIWKRQGSVTGKLGRSYIKAQRHGPKPIVQSRSAIAGARGRGPRVHRSGSRSTNRSEV
jgi:hypothetical protein